MRKLSKLLTTILNPDQIKWAERIAFRQLLQKSNESMTDFASRLRRESLTCSWADTELHANIIEQFLGGLYDKSIQQRLIANSGSFTKIDEVVLRASTMQTAAKASCAIRAKMSHIPRSEFIS